MASERNFALVYWLREKKYSVVKAKDITTKYPDIGQQVTVRWNDGKGQTDHLAKVVDFSGWYE